MCNRNTYWVPAFLALAVMAIAGATVRADSSLVGWWPLDDGSGTVAKDASGNGHDGKLSGDPNWSAGGVDGGSLLFDGKDDYVFIDGHFTLPTYTMAVWFRKDAAGQQDIISAYATGVRHGILLEVGTDGRVRFLNRFPLGTSGGNSVYSTGSFSDGQWHHAAITKSATEIALYLDGRPAGAMADAGVFNPADSFGVTLGCLDNERSPLARQLRGAMDDVRIYNRTLSQKEIVCVMNNYSIDPVGWWKFDETSGTVAVDAAGGRNGTLLPADPNGKGLGPKWVAGKMGGGLQFDGGAAGTTSDYVQLPIGDLISTLESATFAVWVNWAGNGGDWQRILDFGSGTSIYAFLSANRGGTASPRFAMRTATVGEQIVTAPATLGTGWHHLAVAIDSATMTLQMYVDGALVRSGTTTILPKAMGVTTQNWIARSQYPADAYYKGDVDELRIYDRALSQDEVANAMQGGIGFGVANTPSPANKAVNLLPDVSLSWKAGQLGQTHDVYFGTDFNSVASATTAVGLGVLVSPGQPATTYNAGRLAFGKTYYWRVDEVGAAPDFAIVKGNVWSFTVEPVGYPIGKASITATASSSNSADMGPGKTVDGSGLNAGDQHSTKETDMWLSAKTGPQPTWIQYAFDKVYSLNNMLVWNSNQTLEAVVGYGAKSVTVEYSLDGAKWSALGEFEFADASGEATYTANTTVDFGGVAAKFVKLTMNSNWGGLLPQYGLSEVRFSYIPVAAANPSPASGTVELQAPVTLSWRPGREAASHEVYFGTDKANLPLVATIFKTSFDATVELDKTYYWQIVEVNEARPTPRWASDVWTFKTKELPKDAGVANLAAFYSFESNFVDSIGGRNGVVPTDATAVPSFLDGAAGMGKAASFDGTNDYVTLPIGDLINTLESTTFALWVNWSKSGGSWQRIFDFGSSTSIYAFMAANQSGTSSAPRFAMRSATVGEQILNASSVLTTGWHHIAVSIDSTTMTMKLYIDGQTAASGSTTILPKAMGVTTQNWIARSQYAADAYYKGAVDDLRIYNKALSKGEVMWLAGLR